MKFIIPVLRVNSPDFAPIEFGIEDDDSEKEDRTVTLFVRGTDPNIDTSGIYTTVRASDLIKALEWLKRWV